MKIVTFAVFLQSGKELKGLLICTVGIEMKLIELVSKS